MSSVDIILLGLVEEQSRNAYEINKTIEERRVRTWLNVSEAAVYRNLRKLSEHGYLTTRTKKDGLMPEKTMYTVTTAGRSHFHELIEQAARSQFRLGFDFDAWLCHLHNLPTTDATKLLDELVSQLVEERQVMAMILDKFTTTMPPGAVALVDLRHRFMKSAVTWARKLAKDWPKMVS